MPVARRVIYHFDSKHFTYILTFNPERLTRPDAVPTPLPGVSIECPPRTTRYNHLGERESGEAKTTRPGRSGVRRSAQLLSDT
jgi:hypothetical protein